MRRTTSLLMGIPKARVICCAIRGDIIDTNVYAASHDGLSGRVRDNDQHLRQFWRMTASP
jgi:hypothetical protein